jgi:hypothetical protein
VGGGGGGGGGELPWGNADFELECASLIRGVCGPSDLYSGVTMVSQQRFSQWCYNGVTMV